MLLALKRKQLEEEKSILSVKQEQDEVDENTKYKKIEKNKDRFVVPFFDKLASQKFLDFKPHMYFM